jgi:hypothetical protein
MTRLGLTNTGHLNVLKYQACEIRQGKVYKWTHQNYKPRKENIFGLAKHFKMKLKKSEVEFRLLLQKFTVEAGLLGRVKSFYGRPDIS